MKCSKNVYETEGREKADCNTETFLSVLSHYQSVTDVYEITRHWEVLPGAGHEADSPKYAKSVPLRGN